MFEEAKWIGNKSTAENRKGSHLLRKSFSLEEKPKKAILSICGLGIGVYTVNGKRVSDEVLKPQFTSYHKRTIYNEYDVTNLLEVGENVIGVYLGNGFFNDFCEVWGFNKASWKYPPKMIAELDMELSGGRRASVLSDSSWKTADGPCVYNQPRVGEIYDARREIDGWNMPGFDDFGWRKALNYIGAGGIMEKQNMPPIRVAATYKGEYLGNGIYDFGKNMSGWARIKVKAEEGREIVLRYSEKYVNGDIDTRNINITADGDNHVDRYISGGKGTEEWEPDFVYHGFRYVKVENAPDDFEIEAREVHTDLKSVGSFECSDETLNKIHLASRNALLSNYFGIPTDCPHREQNGWLGDSMLSADASIMNFDMNLAYRKWINDLKDCQRADGLVPSIVPSPGYSWGVGLGWESIVIVLPWTMYELTGDKTGIEQNWSGMKKYLRHIYEMSENYVVGEHGLGDWVAYKDEVCPTPPIHTAYYYENARIMSECAKIMGEDGSEYERLAEKVKQAWRAEFSDSALEDKYETVIYSGLYFGIYSEDETLGKTAKLLKMIEGKGNHNTTGIFGTKFMFSVLSENGMGELLYKMVTNPTCPSYAYWINQGATTLCEDWEMKASLNHHMFSEVDNWFYKYLGGIRISHKGLVIKPLFLDEIEWVKASHKDISVEWDREKVKVTVPKPATVIIDGKTENVKAGSYVFSRR